MVNVSNTDASDYTVVGELSQIQNGKERTIDYGSAVLSSEQRRYCTTQKELLAVIKFTRQQQQFYWWRMVKDIKLYVKTCALCAKNKRASLPNRSDMNRYQAGSPI